MKVKNYNLILFSRVHLKDLKTKLILVFCFLLVMRIVANAQWEQTKGPYGGYINTFAISGKNIIAGTYGNAGSVSQITVNAQGQITSAVNTEIQIPISQIK